MSDQIVINVTTEAPANINISDTGDHIDLNSTTLNEGLINHSVTHQSGGSDELLHNLLGGLNGGASGFYYHLNFDQYNNLVTGLVIRPSDTGVFYPNNNPSGYITGIDLSNYSTISFTTGISGFLQNQISTINNNTGAFITQSQTGQFYPVSNPSGYLRNADFSGYATVAFTTGVSGSLQNQINNTGQIISNAVFITGDQNIDGLKDFQTRPTVLDVPVLVSGDSVNTIHLYGKNDQGSTLYKGQPVYINGANGTNPLIKLASNTGERTSSKTIGLLAQDLSVNEFGYIITEGMLEGFNTNSGAAGDPMWLGSNGSIIYGLNNKPYGINHLVSLGIVLRSNSNNGKVYVKVQNGFEIEELHNVYALNPSNKDVLAYNSGSGAWIARQLNTGDISGINSFVQTSATGLFITQFQTGQFYPTSNPSGYLRNADLNDYATTAFTTGISGSLQTQISFLSSQTGSYVNTSSNQNIDGNKTFLQNIVGNGTANRLPNQTATTSDAIITRGLGDSRYSKTSYFARLANNTGYTNDAVGSSALTLTLPEGFYNVSMFVRCISGSNNSKFALSVSSQELRWDGYRETYSNGGSPARIATANAAPSQGGPWGTMIGAENFGRAGILYSPSGGAQISVVLSQNSSSGVMTAFSQGSHFLASPL